MKLCFIIIWIAKAYTLLILIMILKLWSQDHTQDELRIILRKLP